MAKNKNGNRFVSLEKMSKKDKLLHFLKIFGIAFAGFVGIVAGVIVYVAASGGFNPPYIPLDPAWHFSQNEYVIDGNKYIEVDNEGNQVLDNEGNLVFVQNADKDGNPIYEFVMLNPEPEDCTELDAEIKLVDSSNPNMPVVQLVEDENVVALDKEEDEPEGTFHFKYSVKIGSPIYIKPVQTLVENRPVNLSGWMHLIAIQQQLQTECWVYVDVPIEKSTLSLINSENFDTTDGTNENNEDIVLYNVYPNSTLKIDSSTIWPTTSTIYPSTNIPEKKGTTNFNLSKSIVYEVSDEDIATIDQNGNISIKKDKEGNIFSIKAYIISKYNYINNVPSLQDFVDDPERDPSQSPEQLYKKAFNKLVVHSNTLYFKINEIAVQSITTGDKNWPTPIYEVFDNGTINFGREITVDGVTRKMTSSDVGPGRYFVDLILTDEADSGYINELMSNIKMVAVYEDIPAQASTDKITDILQVRINGNSVKSAYEYIFLAKIGDVYKYVIKQYSQKVFYFLFYYTYLDGTVIFDYVQFKLSKNDIGDLVTAKSAIELVHDDYDPATYSLNDFATIVPKVEGENPTYTNIKYFIPQGNDIVDVQDSDLTIKIDNKVYHGISVDITPNGETERVYDYYTLKSFETGSTTLRAVVLKTIPLINEQTGEITGYTYLLNHDDDDYIAWEFYSDPAVQLDIIKDVTFINISLIEEGSENINEDADPQDKDAQCDIYEEVYQGGKLKIQIEYSDIADFVEGKIHFVATNESNVASISNIDIKNRYITFEFNAENAGTKTFQIVYTSSVGDQAIYTIGMKVLSTELVKMTFEDVQNDVSISFDNQGNDISYSWNDLELTLVMDSARSIASYSLIVYELPNGFDASILDKFVGKKNDDVINDLPEEINTLYKFVNSLVISSSVITIDNVGNQQFDAKIIVNDEEFGYKFVHLGSVLIVAEATNDVLSNPILVNFISPQIRVKYGTGQVNDSNEQDVYSQGALTAIDGNTTKAKSVDLYLSAEHTITFIATVDDVDYDISDLIHFTFINNDVVNDSNISRDSGAKIVKNILYFTDVSREMTEKIVASTDFGYENTEFYKYNLKPDYAIQNRYPNSVYKTPSVVDLFNGIVVVTNKEYDETGAVRGNKLFLPIDYVENVNQLKNAPYNFSNAFLDTFKYADDLSGSEYYHIYCNLTIASARSNSNSDVEYRPIDFNRKISLSYFEEDSSSTFIYFDSPVGYSFNTTIKTTPGVSSQFNYNSANQYIVLASNLPDNASFDLFNNYIEFNKQSGFDVDVETIEFAITDKMSDDLLIYKNGYGTMIEGYSEIENYNYKTQAEYDNLADQTGYVQYFTKADNYGTIEEGVEYYTKDVNGQFNLVENPQLVDIGRYYVKVYSQDTYYGLVSSYYEAIDSNKLSSEFVSKYYEKSFEYMLTEDEYAVGGKTYYELVNGEYVEIQNPDIIEEGYYEKVDKYIPATKFKNGTTYYYKHNYRQIESGGDISVAFERFEINLVVQKSNGVITSCLLQISNSLQNIKNSIKLTLKMEVSIINTNSNISFNYAGFCYNWIFEGYEN